MRLFRPLSLCNTVQKLASKVVVNRLMDIMRTLVSPHQASFVPGWQGIENAIICQEYVHSFRYTKRKEGAVMIKVNLEKAYDCMEWSFVESTLEDVGVPGKLISVIMRVLHHGSCNIFWNGEITESFKPSRGLR